MGMSIGSIKGAKFAKATATTVYLMTAVKAGVRPIFNYNDKKADKDSRKYSAANEFLYQLVCLAIAAGMIPFFEAAGFKMAEKRLGKLAESFKGKFAENLKNVADIKGFEELANVKGICLSGSKKIREFKKLHLKHSFDEAHVGKIKAAEAAEEAKRATQADKAIILAEKAEHLLNGGLEAGSLLGSIIGLTIAAPILSHKILHPVMKAMGLSKEEHKKDENPALYALKQPITPENHHKVNTNA